MSKKGLVRIRSSNPFCIQHQPTHYHQSTPSLYFKERGKGVSFSTHQPISPSTSQPLNISTPQPLNPSTHFQIPKFSHYPMLIKSSSVYLPKPTQEVSFEETNSDAESSYSDYIHYAKFSLISRKDLFIIAFYKTENLEKFKANIANADILAPIFANLLKFYFPDLHNYLLITTPKRSHSEKLGYHFASEICSRTSQLSGIEFFPEFMVARSKQKYKPDFTQIKPLPKNKRLILFDDIGTTYQTIYETLKTLRENPENNLENASIPIFVGINNN